LALSLTFAFSAFAGINTFSRRGVAAASAAERRRINLNDQHYNDDDPDDY
jgi:hypothetical protein